MKKSFLIVTIICMIAALSLAAYAINNNAISHPDSSQKYNENPAPIYVANDKKDASNFVSEDKCLKNIVQTETSKIKSSTLTTWKQYVTDEKEEAINYQIDDNRMVRVIKIEYPDGLDTKAGFYKNAVSTIVFDAESGNLITSVVTGDYQGRALRK